MKKRNKKILIRMGTALSRKIVFYFFNEKKFCFFIFEEVGVEFIENHKFGRY